MEGKIGKNANQVGPIMPNPGQGPTINPGKAGDVAQSAGMAMR